jgi:hypothetical protein
MTCKELTDTLLTDGGLLPHIIRQGSVLNGTRLFWRNKSNSLQAQACFLSPSTAPVFLTFSTANMQWQDLHWYFPRFKNAANDQMHWTFVWEGVQNNPHMVAHYLLIHLRAFIDHVLCLLLGFTDSWDCFEWQAHGSGYLYALFWIPTALALRVKTEEARTQFAHYWDALIIAWNPDSLWLLDVQNPASLASADVANTADQFAAFLNHLQVHLVCQAPYCLWVVKGAEQPTCWFFFPQPLFTDPVVTQEINPKAWLFSPAHNQANLNQCAPVIIMG